MNALAATCARLRDAITSIPPLRDTAEPTEHGLGQLRRRLVVGAALFAFGFAALGAGLVDATILRPDPEAHARYAPAAAAGGPQRADIVDRNGELLATTVPAVGLYANTRLVTSPDEAALRLATVLPSLDLAEAARKLASGSTFVWLKRVVTPREAHAVNRLGEPGLGFLPTERRVYPAADLTAHIVGYTGIDNRGLAGVEARFDARLREAPTEPLPLSVDLRFQYIVHQELAQAMSRFKASGAAAILLDADTAEVLAMVSLPVFDPNSLHNAERSQRFNRAALGVYEMGSTFKAFTVAQALESGKMTLADGYDTSVPLRLARYTIRDFHGKNRWLSLPEIFIYSSNIGAAMIALELGVEAQREFLGKLGLLEAAPFELPETGAPLLPPRWRELNVATIAFGHGIAVSPLQMTAAIAALVNGGVWRPPTLLTGPTERGREVIAAQTSAEMRNLFRRVVTEGTGSKAAIKGYAVGGKTGTAEKLTKGRYDGDRLVSSFVAAFPIDNPRFVILVVIDEPKGIPETHNYATGGWTAAPTAGRIVERIAPMAGIAPDFGTVSASTVAAASADMGGIRVAAN